MLSIRIPSSIKLYTAPGYLKRVGPLGSFQKKTGNLQFSVISSVEESRLFIKGSSVKEEATALSQLSQRILGLSRGFRRRLRLVGIGFRATLRELKNDSTKKARVRPNFRRKRIVFFNTQKRRTGDSRNCSALSLKIGYSNESVYPFIPQTNRELKASRIDGRSKGTVISVQGVNKKEVSQIVTEIRSFRQPDIYKGKGIHFDNEVRVYKKGKRQG